MILELILILVCFVLVWKLFELIIRFISSILTDDFQKWKNQREVQIKLGSSYMEKKINEIDLSVEEKLELMKSIEKLETIYHRTTPKIKTEILSYERNKNDSMEEDFFQFLKDTKRKPYINLKEIKEEFGL